MKSWDTCTADVERILDKHCTPGRKGSVIEHIVLHHNGGTLTVDGCYDVWQTREASAHYQVEESGIIGQLVHDRDTAWHAADATENRRSIGIEHANESSPTSRISDATLDNGAHLVAALCNLYQLGRPQWGKNVFGHNNFHNTDCPGHLTGPDNIANEPAGDQRLAYMARAQHWYDVMTGAVTPTQTTASVTSSAKPATAVDARKPFSLAFTLNGIKAGTPNGNVTILQALLNESGWTRQAGYDPIPLDGMWTARTQRVWRAFQSRPEFGFGPKDIDGMPGKTSLSSLLDWSKKYRMVP